MSTLLKIATSLLVCSVISAPAQAQSINWVYANGYAKNHPNVGLVADEFIKRIEAATNGRLKIRHVAAGALLKPENMIEGLRGRTAQMGSAVTFFFPGQLPISATLGGITDLKLGNQLDPVGVAAVTMKLSSETPEFAQEYEKLGIKPIFWISPPPYAFIGTKPMARLDDLKGKKFRSFGSSLPLMLTSVGAVPLSMAYGEVYTSLQTGVIDGALSDVNGMVPGKWQEVAKHVLTTGPRDGALNAIAPIVYIVNLDAWNALPADLRQAVEKVARELPPAATKIVAESAIESIATLQKAGVTIRHLSQADTDAIAAKAPNLYQAAIKSLSDAGLPGDRIVRRYQELANSYVTGGWKP
jgi:TRAP-type C4-dicarboxylate transport system substrate-binding protein